MDETDEENEIASVDCGLTGVEVYAAIFSDRFRDACSHGDVQMMSSILDDLSQADQVELIHRLSFPFGPPIFEAISSSQINAVEFILEKGYNIETEYEIDINMPILLKDKCTALCVACACGDIDSVKILLKHNADVNHVSLNATPIIYASQYNNVELVSLLLSHGADVNLMPTSYSSQIVFVPLFQACMNGHSETAELLMEKVENKIGVERKICYLGLLGAQCINNYEDFERGVMFWKTALQSLAELCQTELISSNIRSSDSEMMQKLKKFYADSSKHTVINHISFQGVNNSKPVDKADPPTEFNITSPLYESAFKDMQLCSTLEELETLSKDKKKLTLQALLVLQDILGPSHSETVASMDKAAKTFMELGDLEFSCKILLYGAESNDKNNITEKTSQYCSLLAENLLKCIYGDEGQRNFINFSSLKFIIFATLELIIKGMVRIQKNVFLQDSNLSEGSQIFHAYAQPGFKCVFTIRLFTELVESFMALLRTLFDILPSQACQYNENDDKIMTELKRSVSSLISLCHKTTPPFSKFSLESEMMKIAVCGDHSALSTLYFHQGELFPNLVVLDFLLICGISTNCVDFQGETPLHHGIDCSYPNREVIIKLLEYGADVDICNRQGITPYKMLFQTPKLNINPFNYMTLKCLAATAIIKYHIPYNGELPKLVESFVSMHSMPRIQLLFKKNQTV
ncbi:hypothetical protein HELRODRAFT_178284 [Helobdella robusta]|uniref:SOCS box domain-containing protein n=1 Tax=Helobdella robusta TaxID=6412 RepID=T1FD12_HELRO|nr:hypothetical protein HELRODRAFT_178284 [Helobdella robusta]ESN97175.1 hypothetical protein HELRODRAFT_178284 [Helobdella robusta]